MDTQADELQHREHGSGPAVLLIHGTAAAQWGELPSLLARGHRVIDYDRRSFAGSRGAPSSLSEHAGDAAVLIEQLGAAPVTVVGWSIGGVVAVELAATRPGLVAGLVLVEPPFQAKRRPTLRLLVAIAKVQLLRRLRDDRAAATAFLRWAGQRRDGSTELERMSQPERDRLLANATAIVREIELGTGEHLDVDQLRAIRCPVTCLTGELSERAFHKSVDRLARLLPGARVEAPIPGAGHWLALDAPRRIAEAVAELPAPPAG